MDLPSNAENPAEMAKVRMYITPITSLERVLLIHSLELGIKDYDNRAKKWITQKVIHSRLLRNKDILTELRKRVIATHPVPLLADMLSAIAEEDINDGR